MQPFYKKGVNGGKDEDSVMYVDAAVIASKEVENPVPSTSTLKSSSEPSNISSEMKRDAIYKMSTPEFFDLLKRIKLIHGSVVQNIKESYTVPKACDKWRTKQLDRYELSFLINGVDSFLSLELWIYVVSHLLQMLMLCCAFRQLPFQEKHVLQQASILGNLEMFGILQRSETVGDPKLKEYSCCIDEQYEDQNGTPAVVEFGAVEDLDLDAIESLRGVPYLAIGKHLCGPATGDNTITVSNWNENFDAVAGGVEEVVRNMKAVDRAILGLMCKEVIDFGRLMWVKEHHGLDAQLVKYVPARISPENHLLVASG
ncbi:hypothetical protein ACLOJK_021977 [Asimina triloba]